MELDSADAQRLDDKKDSVLIRCAEVGMMILSIGG